MAAALLALGFLVPLHELPWPGFVSDLCAAVALALLVLRSPPRRWPWPALGVLALAIVPLVQHAAGLILYRGDAVVASLYLLGLAFAIQVGAQPAFVESGEAGRFVRAVFYAALASALIALVHAAGLMPPGPWLGPQLEIGRAVANLAQPNLLATLLVLGLVALLAGWPADRRRQAFAGLAATLLIVALALTGSRAGLLQAVLLLGLGMVSPQRLGLGLSRRGLLALLALLLLTVLLTALVLKGVGPQAQAIRPSHARGWADAKGISARWGYLQLFLEALQSSPWFGYGFNQISVAQARQTLHTPTVLDWTEHSHNLALDLLLWCGLPLGLLVLAGLAFVLGQGLRAMRHDARLGPVALALLVLLVHASLEYPLDYFIFLLPFGLLLGRLCTPCRDVEWPVPANWAAMALGAAMLLTVVVDYRRIRPPLIQARLALMQPMVLPDMPAPLLLDQLEIQYRMARYLGRKDADAQSLPALEAGTQRFAYPFVMARLAQDAEAQGDTAMATRLRARLSAMRGHRLGT